MTTTQLVSASNVNAFSTLTSPEQAAQLFLSAVSKGLASVIAKELDTALTAVAPQTTNNEAIKGWQEMIKGGVVQLDWERPIGAPTGQVIAFAPRTSGGFAAMGVEIGIGITVKGSF